MSVIDTKKQTVVAELVAKFGTTVNRTDVVSVCQKHGVSWGFLTGTKVGRGTYDISALVGSASTPVASKPELTDEEILTSQRRRFRTLDRMAQGVVRKQVLLVSVRPIRLKAFLRVLPMMRRSSILEFVGSSRPLAFTNCSGKIVKRIRSSCSTMLTLFLLMKSR